MSEIDEQLNNVLELEADNKNISNWFGERGSITKTAEIRKVITIDEHLESKTLKPDKISKILLGAFLLFGPVMALVKIFKTKSNPYGMYVIIPIVFLLVFIGFIIESTSRRLNYTITISREGIAFDETLYKWTDIKETAFLHLSVGGKNGTKFLLLLFNNNEYDTWELTKFQSFYPSFDTKLANYIEHFKPKLIDP